MWTVWRGGWEFSSTEGPVSPGQRQGWVLPASRLPSQRPLDVAHMSGEGRPSRCTKCIRRLPGWDLAEPCWIKKWTPWSLKVRAGGRVTLPQPVSAGHLASLVNQLRWLTTPLLTNENLERKSLETSRHQPIPEGNSLHLMAEKDWLSGRVLGSP